MEKQLSSQYSCRRGTVHEGKLTLEDLSRAVYWTRLRCSVDLGKRLLPFPDFDEDCRDNWTGECSQWLDYRMTVRLRIGFGWRLATRQRESLQTEARNKWTTGSMTAVFIGKNPKHSRVWRSSCWDSNETERTLYQSSYLYEQPDQNLLTKQPVYITRYGRSDGQLHWWWRHNTHTGLNAIKRCIQTLVSFSMVQRYFESTCCHPMWQIGLESVL